MNDTGTIIAHQIRAGYAGQQPLIACSGGDQEPAWQIVHARRVRLGERHAA